MAIRRVKDIQELRREFDSIKSTTAGDVRFIAQAMMFNAEQRHAAERGHAKRKASQSPSAWQRFFAAGMKAGKTPAEIGAEWRARKAATS